MHRAALEPPNVLLTLSDHAGVVTATEAMRILTSLHVKPRRTIRIALWSGEEEGIFGSAGYVSNHFATFHYSKRVSCGSEDQVPRP